MTLFKIILNDAGVIATNPSLAKLMWGPAKLKLCCTASNNYRTKLTKVRVYGVWCTCFKLLLLRAHIVRFNVRALWQLELTSKREMDCFLSSHFDMK